MATSTWAMCIMVSGILYDQDNKIRRCLHICVMETRNAVFIATSIDGFIADANGGISWLDSVPEINEVDTGYHEFMQRTDALVMGRNTYETVLGFGGEWPYSKHVFVLSNSLQSVPAELNEKVTLMGGSVKEVLQKIHELGFFHLYIDGGKTIQQFMSSDLIDELIITTIPIVLGGGIPLFGALPQPLMFELAWQKTFVNKVEQRCFVRSKQ